MLCFPGTHLNGPHWFFSVYPEYQPPGRERTIRANTLEV